MLQGDLDVLSNREEFVIFMQSRVPQGPGKFHVVVLVIIIIIIYCCCCYCYCYYHYYYAFEVCCMIFDGRSLLMSAKNHGAEMERTFLKIPTELFVWCCPLFISLPQATQNNLSWDAHSQGTNHNRDHLSPSVQHFFKLHCPFLILCDLLILLFHNKF